MTFLKKVSVSGIYTNQWFILGASIVGAFILLICCCAAVIHIRNRQKSNNNTDTLEWQSNTAPVSNRSEIESSHDSTVGSINQTIDRHRRTGLYNALEVYQCDPDAHCMVELQIDSRGATPNDVVSYRQTCITAEDDISSDISGLSSNIYVNKTVSLSPPIATVAPTTIPKIAPQMSDDNQITMPDFDAATNTVISVNDGDIIPFFKNSPENGNPLISTIAEEYNQSNYSPKDSTALKVTLHPRREEAPTIEKHRRDLSNSVITMDSSSETDSDASNQYSNQELEQTENSRKKRLSISALERAKIVSKHRLRFES